MIINLDCKLSITFWEFVHDAIKCTLWLYLSMQFLKTCWLCSFIKSISSNTTIYAGSVYDSGNRVLTSVTHVAGPGISLPLQVTTGPGANVTINNTGVLSLTANSGQVTANATTGNIVFGLATTTVTAGTYGTSSVVPAYTVDAYGRITTVSTYNISISAGSVSGLAPSATTDTTNAGNITSGTLNAARLPTISAGSITGLAASATTDTTSATNITTGTLGAARLPYSMDQSVATTNNVRFSSLGIGTAASGTAGEIRATNEITAYYSDDRLKTKLGTIENALDKVSSLTGFYYEPNQTAQDLGYEVKKHVGVSAQQVQNVLPEVVKDAPIGQGYLTVQYEKLVPLLIEAIKELKAEIEVLKGNNKWQHRLDLRY